MTRRGSAVAKPKSGKSSEETNNNSDGLWLGILRHGGNGLDRYVIKIENKSLTQAMYITEIHNPITSKLPAVQAAVNDSQTFEYGLNARCANIFHDPERAAQQGWKNITKEMTSSCNVGTNSRVIFKFPPAVVRILPGQFVFLLLACEGTLYYADPPLEKKKEENLVTLQNEHLAVYQLLPFTYCADKKDINLYDEFRVFCGSIQYKFEVKHFSREMLHISKYADILVVTA